MHPNSMQEMQKLINKYLNPRDNLKVLDVGSYSVNGSYRSLFPHENWTYEGADLNAGPNVDTVLSEPYDWDLNKQYDVIISGQALEHVKFFWLTWKTMVKHVKPGGKIFLIVPSSGFEHRYPVDCWRFYKDGLVALAELESLEVLEAHVSNAEPWRDAVGAYRKP